MALSLPAAAASLGLSPDGDAFRGELDGRPLQLAQVKRTLHLEIGGSLPALFLARRSNEPAKPLTPLQVYTGRPGQLETPTMDGTGDPHFDARFLVGGEEPVFLAAWTAQARRMALELDRLAAIDLDADRLRLVIANPTDLSPLAQAAIEFMAALQERVPGPPALLEACTDPELGVRLRAFDALRGLFPASAQAAEAEALFMARKDPAEALLAAILADNATALREQSPAELAAIIWQQPAIIRELLARHLETCGDVAALAMLLRTGGNDGDSGALRVSLLNALGRIGGSEVIADLKTIATGSYIAQRIAEAAQEALAQIESRIGTGKAGEVSLADPPRGGDLSEAGGEGSLSEPDEEE